MKGQSIIAGNLLIFPFLTGITLITTACFTVITDDTRRQGQGVNFVPRAPTNTDFSSDSWSPSTERSNKTYELELIADPNDTAEFVVSPTPDSNGAYLAGTTVNIDVLPEPGWEIKRWIGPVYDISSDAAKINMAGDLAVLVRMVKTDPIAAPEEVTSRPASNGTP